MKVKCDLCAFTATCKARLKVHQLAAHCDLKPLPCTFPGCNFRTKTKAHLQEHSRRHETNPELRKPFPCTFEGCGYRGAGKSKLNAHVNTVHNTGRTRDVQCVLCPSKFFNQKGLSSHIKEHLKEERFKCSYCDYKTHIGSYLPRHVRDVHQRLRLFTCSFPGCSYNTNHKSGFNQHIKRHSADLLVRRPVACNYPDCDYRTINGSTLKKHTSACHNPTRTMEFTCHFCSKAFYWKVSLTRHVKVAHLNEKSYKCDKCKYAGTRLQELKNHWNRVHDKGGTKTRFMCESCEYRAFCKSELDLHTRARHTKEIQFLCSQPGCDYRSNYNVYFKKHLLTHEVDPEKRFPFGCAFPGCDFRTRVKAEMRAHEQNHGISKMKLKCKSCPHRCYPDSQSLHFHKRITHAKAVHKCTACDYGTSEKRFLQQHIRTCHFGVTTGHPGDDSATASSNYTRASGTGALSDARKLGVGGNPPPPTCDVRKQKQNLALELDVLKNAPFVVLERISVKAV